MSSARTITSLVITIAAAAALNVAGCKKDQTTPPDGDSTPPTDDSEDDQDVEAPDQDDDDEPAAVLDKAGFDEIIHEHFEEVSDCYVAALEGNPKLQGKLNAEFKIGDEGQVLGVIAIDDSTLKDEGLLACINQAAASWTFARPPHGEMSLRYVYNLAPG